MTQSSRDTLSVVDRKEARATISGHYLAHSNNFQTLYGYGDTKIQLYSLPANNLVLEELYAPLNPIPLKSDGSYMIVLQNEDMPGLVLGRVDYNASSQDIIQVSANPSQKSAKLIRDGQLYIQSDGAMYNAEGIRIK